MLRRWISAVVLIAGSVSLAGCGAVSGMNGAPVGASTNLVGNWLLAGSLPSIGTPTPAATGVTATFDVTGTSVVGALTTQLPCGSSGFTADLGGVVSGTVAADGSFTLQTPTIGLGGNTETIQGHVPTTAGGGWTGTYTIVISGCGTLTGQIAATPIPLIGGTFAGTTTLAPFGSPPVPVTVTTNLLQGGNVTNGSSTLYSAVFLGGTIAIAGSPCFTSGTSSGAVPRVGAVEGNTVIAQFLMNDGSTLEMIGSISSVDSTRLQVSFLLTGTGTCGQLGATPSTLLIKQ
jgi:hypothetical protein